ncbi:MAG: hypothetical protein GY757_61420 [bacterium]|nr:hypothetical protein [bacterium]
MKSGIFFYCFILMILVVSGPLLGEAAAPVISARLIPVDKLPAVSDKPEYFFTPGDIFRYNRQGELIILSQKRARVYIFDSTHKFVASFFRKGLGPGELSYPSNLFPLPANRLLIVNQDTTRFMVVKRDTNKLTEVERFPVPYHNIGDFEIISPNRLAVLTAFPIMPDLKDISSKYFLHFYDLPTKKKGADVFPPPEIVKFDKSAESRSKYGTGDILFFDGKLFIVYNQPGSLYVLNRNGSLLKKISTSFPFTKMNLPAVKKKVFDDGTLSLQVKYGNSCRMNLVELEGRIYLITSIDNGKNNEDPVFTFYLSALDYKNGTFSRHLKLNSGGVDITQARFAGYSGKNIAFIDDDYLYRFTVK